MVVSVDISGILEERLRRLVDIGLYASVAEAVRDGVRRLLKDLDLSKFAIELYEKKNVTLRYACYFSGISCDEFIDKLIMNSVYPLIGEVTREQLELPRGTVLILFSSSIYTLFKSELINYINNLWRLGYVVAVPDVVMEYYRIMQAYSLIKGILRDETSIEVFHGCGRPFKIESRRSIIMADDEAKSLELSGGCKNTVIVADDIRLREYLRDIGLSAISSVSLLELLIKNNLISKIEFNNILFSMKSIPLLIPPELEKMSREETF